MKHLMVAALMCGAGVASAGTGLEHEAELQSGERLTIANHRNLAESYRVCIAELPGDVKLKVVHDGEVTEVLDGTCQTVTGRHIYVKADSKLPPGESLELKFISTPA